MDVVVEQSMLADDEEAEISAWTVPDGATVELGQLIAEIATSKVIVELHAPAPGTLRIAVPAGEVIAPGTVIATIA